MAAFRRAQDWEGVIPLVEGDSMFSQRSGDGCMVVLPAVGGAKRNLVEQRAVKHAHLLDDQHLASSWVSGWVGGWVGG